MIVRIWRGRATPANADAYRRHVAEHVYPSLGEIDGHLGAFLLHREESGGVEFLAVTLWDSLDTISGFAGEDIETAVVEPQARAVLAEYDDVARHYDVAHVSGRAGSRCAGGWRRDE